MTKSINSPGNYETAHWAIQVISRERLSHYLSQTNWDMSAALKLYQHNLAFSSDLYQWLALAEIVLRNAMVASISPPQLSNTEFDPFLHIWQDLRPEERSDYLKAARRAISKRNESSPSRIIAELNFGFWKYLLAADYEHTLWIRNFRHAFVTLRKKDRHQVHSTVELVNHLRNRVAHHERLIQVNLKQEIQALMRLLGWISPESLDWATANLPPIQVNLTQKKSN